MRPRVWVAQDRLAQTNGPEYTVAIVTMNHEEEQVVTGHPDASNGTTDSAQPIYTVGYGARTLEALVEILKTHRISTVVDVRSAPYSRFKPEFSKDALERTLKQHGLRYLYLGDALGGRPADPDCYVDDRVDYERVKQKDSYRSGIERLRAAWQRGVRFVILCSEGKPEQCHRSKLIGESLAALAIPVAHIDENDQLRSQVEILERLTAGQLSLFGDYEFTSRKRYAARARSAGAEDEEDDDA